MKKTILIASISAILLSANISFAASFNCKKAGTLVEKAICQNKVLSKLDEEMAGSYYDLEHYFKETAPAAQRLANLQRTQKQWRSKRDQCKTTTCIETSYEKRIKELRTQWEIIANE